MDWARDLCESFAGMAGVDFMGTEPLFNRKYLRELVHHWVAQDPHRDNDRAYLEDFTKAGLTPKLPLGTVKRVLWMDDP
jgi:hypothetical protein